MSKIGRRRNKENGGKKTIKLTVNIEDKYMAVIDKGFDIKFEKDEESGEIRLLAE